IRLTDGSTQRRRKGRLVKPQPDLRLGRLQRRDAGGIDPRQQIDDPVADAAVLQMPVIGLGRDGEAGRDRQALPGHLRQTQRLAADQPGVQAGLLVETDGQHCRPHSTVTVPARPSMRTRWPVFSRAEAKPVETTAGMPYSRQTMAAWLIMPPMSVTTPATTEKAEAQDGAVIGATRISPGCR